MGCLLAQESYCGMFLCRPRRCGASASACVILRRERGLGPWIYMLNENRIDEFVPRRAAGQG